MKAKDRHRLKTNELAQTMSELIDYIRQHGNRLLTIAVILLVVVVGGGWWLRSRTTQQRQQHEQLAAQLQRTSLMQVEAAQRAQLGSELADEQPAAAPYDAETVSAVLGNLSQEAQGAAVGMTALLAQAEVARSALYFSEQDISPGQKSELCAQVRDIYNQILQQYPHETWVVGFARMGLALVDEELGQWDQARQKYEEIAADDGEKLAGTAFPRLAQKRLDILDDISIPIDLPLTPPVPEFDLNDLIPSDLDILPEPNILPETVKDITPDPNKISQPAQKTIIDPNKTSIKPPR